MKLSFVAVLALLAIAAPASAKWTEVGANRTVVAGSALSVMAGPGWNRWSKKPIRKEELWSFDGPLLNRIEFFGGIASGEALARETNKKREPLPKFAASMKAAEIADLVERTLRVTEHAPDFMFETVEPMAFAGKPGFRFRYRYTSGELIRRGEARGGIVAGKLYMIAYSAPALYYFDAHLPRAAAIMESARIG